MAQYHLTIFGKKYLVSKKTFLILLFPMLGFWVAYLWCLCGGIWRFGQMYFDSGMLTMSFMIVVFGSIKINDVHYGLLPENKFVGTVSRIVCYSAVVYYIYHVMTYGF